MSPFKVILYNGFNSSKCLRLKDNDNYYTEAKYHQYLFFLPSLLLKFFYCYSITVVCFFSPSILILSGVADRSQHFCTGKSSKFHWNILLGKFSLKIFFENLNTPHFFLHCTSNSLETSLNQCSHKSKN